MSHTCLAQIFRTRPSTWRPLRDCANDPAFGNFGRVYCCNWRTLFSTSCLTKLLCCLELLLNPARFRRNMNISQWIQRTPIRRHPKDFFGIQGLFRTPGLASSPKSVKDFIIPGTNQFVVIAAYAPNLNLNVGRAGRIRLQNAGSAGCQRRKTEPLKRCEFEPWRTGKALGSKGGWTPGTGTGSQTATR